MNHPDTTTAHSASKPAFNLLPHSGGGHPFSFLLVILLGVLNLFLVAPLQARPSAPAAPSNLAATIVSSTQINLSWRDNSGNESGFTIERSISATGPWLQIASTAVNATSYSNSGLSAATTYYYRVYAYNSRGSSSYSSVASATTAQGSVPSCTYSISPASASFPSGGGNGNSSVATSSGCNWTATSGATWITLTTGANGTGSGTTTFSVAANTSTSSRTGTLTIAGQTFTVSQAAAAVSGPANDYCANGIVTSGSSATRTGSNVGATKEAGEPNHAGYPGGKSVWWSWSAPSAGSVTINTLGSSFDTLLAVYTGTSVSTLTTVASNDDSGGMQSSVTFNASAGITYQIAVDGYAAASGDVTLNLSQTTTACSYSISPASTNPGSGAGSGTITVTAGAGCAWTATSSATTWLTCSPATGTANGTVTWSATANTSTSSRTGTLTIAGQTFTVTQSGVACTYAISSTSANPTAAASSGAVTVTAGAGCNWTASSSATSWLTCTPASGTGNGSVTWSVAANSSTSSRTGTLTIAGQTFTVTQSGVACTYSISSTSASPGSSAASGSVNVTALAGCSWTASSSATSWLTCTPASGTGNGSVTWSATANTSTSSRTGTLTIAGQTYTVTQSGVACTYSISSTSASPGSSAANGSVNVTALAGCSWTASSSATSWLTCTPASGSGNGTATWSATANTSTSSRTGTLTIAGQPFTVTQAGAVCTFTIGGSSASFGSAGGPGSVNVTASGSTCTWTASSSAGWITINSGVSGTGNGTVSYSVAVNTATSSRSGNLTIAGQTFTVTEAGATPDSPPTASLTSPSNGATISGMASFSGTASDDYGVTRVEFWCDGSVLLGSATTAPYSISYNTAGMANGSHTFTCKAYDTANHTTTSAAISATINNTVTIPGGQLQWVRTMPGFGGSHVVASCIAADNSGNAVAAGYFTSSTDFGGGTVIGPGGLAAFIAKYSPQNTLLWAKTFGTAADKSIIALAVDSQDNIIVTGYFYSSVDFGGTTLVSRGFGDIFVAKYSPSGSLLWAKSFGGTANDKGYSVALDADDNVIIAGMFQNTVTFGSVTFTSYAYSPDIALVKMSSAAGAVLWAKQYGGNDNDYAYSLAVDRFGDVVVTGQVLGPANLGGGLTASGGSFAAKYSASDGSYKWAKVLSATSGNGITTDPNTGNIFVTGGFSGSVDFGGGPITTRYNGGIFLVAYDPNGSYLWAKAWGGSGDVGAAVSVDASGHLAFTGQANNGIDFTGTGIYMIGHGLIVSSFTISGNSPPVYQWAKRANDVSSGYGIAYDTLGNVWAAGFFEGIADFGGISVNSTGWDDGFVAKYTR